jgi:hypothetical protein
MVLMEAKSLKVQRGLAWDLNLARNTRITSL